MNSKSFASTPHARQTLVNQVGNAFFSEALFDVMPDVVFFVKDLEGRYVVVNQTLASRCGYRAKAELIGRSASNVFPAPLATSYDEQDQFVLNTGRDLHQQLELRLYPSGEANWCVTHKIPLRDKLNKVIGLTGISRDLTMPDQRHPVYHSIATAVRHLHSNYAQEIQVTHLAQMSNLSAPEFENNFHQIFSITPRQMVIKLRLDAAIALLSDAGKTLDQIAKEVGYSDVTVFSSIFKTTIGLTPAEYRETVVARITHRRRH